MVISKDTPTAKGKSGFLCSCPVTAKALEPVLQQQGLHLEDSKKWLGIDYQPAATQPKQPTRVARLKKVRHNWAKTRQHHAKFGRGGEVVKQGHCASLAYGASCMGSPSAVTAYVAAKTRSTMANAGRFRSGRLGAAVSSDRSAARLALAPVKAWVEEAWEQPGQHLVMKKTWSKQTAKLKQVVKLGFKVVWATVRGPAGAAWAVMTELGGKMSSALVIEAAGSTCNLTEACPT